MMTMRRRMVALLLAASWGFGGLAMAHEGHEHKIMGQVVAVDEKHIEVQSTDGKKVSGLLGPKTVYKKGQATAGPSDVKVGQRVVLMVVEEKGEQNVTQVLLGTKEPAPAPEQKH